ncbi:transmembrane protein 235-like [Sinocyclocheilus rhinocerous]|uniref:transmembrane protein 235-like n=1 Tax=Sinocyclocheilus rhinocerous TaxID=307959 RepID=UPI0007B97D26|nr:PREDICTED: transmembrane protein 235-like [Sinocyclocheilus rhinocerous]
MKMNFGTVVISAGLCGLLSFILLALSIGTEYWYIIDVDEGKNSSLEYSSSHSGLWRIYEGQNGSYHDISFYTDTSDHTEQEKHLLNLHRVIVVLLPLSLVLLVFGGIFGLVASLAQSCTLLTCIAAYFLICSLVTVSGVSIYISYSQQALEELQHMVDIKSLSHVHMSFGWSLVMACLSFCLELLTGILLMLAARLIRRQCQHEPAAVLTMSQSSPQLLRLQ